MGYELVRFSFTVNLTDVGQVTTIGLPVSISPIVDSNRNDDLIDEVIIASDPQNYSILKVTHNKNSNSEITFVKFPYVLGLGKSPNKIESDAIIPAGCFTNSGRV